MESELKSKRAIARLQDQLTSATAGKKRLESASKAAVKNENENPQGTPTGKSKRDLSQPRTPLSARKQAQSSLTPSRRTEGEHYGYHCQVSL